MSTQTKNRIILLAIFLTAFDILIWRQIISGPASHPEIYFFDVGQGDSQLVILPGPAGGIRILIDGGPSKQGLTALLAETLPAGPRYFDLVIMSHPQADHFTGLIDILKRYPVGAFISNGARGSAASFQELEAVLKEKSIPSINLAQGDSIKYNDYFLGVLAPSSELLKEPGFNDGSLVLLLKAGSASALFTGDIGFKAEDYLVKNHQIDIDILKVAHHGSKYASSKAFLNAATPKVSVIEVGRNSYGHPTKETLSRLAAVASQVYRTDQDGTIKLVLNGQKVLVNIEKSLIVK